VSILGAIGEGLVELEPTGSGNAARLNPGGDAANICVMAARLGCGTRLLARIGGDPLGARLKDYWADQGIDTGHVHTDSRRVTGLYLNESTKHGHRFSYWRVGSAGSHLHPSDIDRRFLDGLEMLAVTGITLSVSTSSAEATEAAIELARAQGATVALVLNFRPALEPDPRVLARIAAGSDIVIGSVEDFEAIFGDRDRALRELTGDGLDREVAVTDGLGPALAVRGAEVARQAVPAVQVANAAGAGDAFAGAYLATRLGGGSLPAALKMAVAAASVSVQRPGCSRSYPSLEETEDALRQLPADPPLSTVATPAR
jgi:2-dehydro-3-deoxygluconokinase